MQARNGIRWRIVWILFGSTAINYINRQTFSLLAPVISSELHFSHEDLSRVFGAFQLTYAWTWLFGGFLLDLIGARIGLALAVIWWSIASMLTGLAHSVASFSLFRSLLGIGEGLNWPGASKVVAEWFPARERGLAVAIFDSGSSIGAAIAALTIPILALAVGWRRAFVFSGILGILWLVLWWTNYRPRKPDEAAKQQPFAVAIRGLWRDRNAWGIVFGRSLTDPMWWFYVFWLPQYLSDARGFSLKQIAAFAWIPFVAADLGNFTGGWISGLLIRRGMPVIRARKLICIVTCAPMLAGIPAVLAHNPYWALFLVCVALWGYAAWSTMGLTFPSDLFPSNVVATVTGISGFAAGMMGTAVTLIVGRLVDKFSYMPAFVFASMLPLLATIAVLALIRDIAPTPGRST